MFRNQAIRTARQASRRPAGARPVVLRNSGQVSRTYATVGQQQEAKNASSHIAAGIGGGAVVLLGLYGYYHVSGAKKRMDQLHSVSETFTQVKEKAVQATPSPKAAINFLKSVANSYAAVIPGGSYVVDQTFQQLDQIAEKHGPELSKITNQAYSEIQKAMAEGGDNATDQVIAAVQGAMTQISKLSDQFTSNILKPYLDKSPQLKEALGDSLDQLNEFSEKYGPQAKDLARDTINDIQKLTKEGLNGETITKAAALAKERLEKIKELGAKAGSDAYSKAADAAKPYLEKAPDVKKYFEENLDKLKDYVGDDGVKLINDTYAELEEAGKKGDTKALTSIVKDRVGKLQQLAKEKGADKLGGASKLFDQLPDMGNLQELQKLAKEKGGDFEKLLSETTEELKKLMEEKGKKAKDLASETGQEAKKQATK